MGTAVSHAGGVGNATVDKDRCNMSSGTKAIAADARSSPSTTRGSDGSTNQPAPDAIAMIAASDHGDSDSGAGTAKPDKGTGDGGAGVNATSPSSPTTCGVLQRDARSRTSTPAAEFPAGNQASRRVPAGAWNSRRASEDSTTSTPATSSPSTAGDDNADATQHEDCMANMIATSGRADSVSGADIRKSDTANGSSGASTNAPSTSTSTTSSALPCRTRSRMSTPALEFPAGFQASGRVPVGLWNSRQASEDDAIRAATTPSPSAAGDNNDGISQPVDIVVCNGQATPQPPPAAQPGQPRPGPSSIQQPPPAGQPSVPTHGPSSHQQPPPPTAAENDGAVHFCLIMEWLRSWVQTTEQVLGTTELLAAESQACVAQRLGMAPMNPGSPTNPSLASLPLSPTVCSKPLVVTVGAALDRVSGDLAGCCGHGGGAGTGPFTPTPPPPPCRVLAPKCRTMGAEGALRKFCLT